MNAPSSPSRLFSWLRWRLLRNSVGLMLRGSLVRVVTIMLCSLLIWGMLFAVAMIGFQELKQRWEVPLDGFVLELLFDLLFFSLTIMLIFSTGIILYASLFAAPESGFLLSTPAGDDHVFAYKFQGAVGFSSWGFLLLGSPILIGYGLRIGEGAPWYFYAVLPLFFLGFVLIPGALGALACLVLVNFTPRHLKQILIGAITIVLGISLVWGWLRLREAATTVATRSWFDSLFAELAIFGGRLVPFQWIARGLVSAARGEPGAMAWHLGLVWSNGLFLYVASAWLGKKLFRRGFNRVATGGTLRKRYGGHRLDALLDRLLFFLDPQTRLLMVKDFRTFRRDPAQWAQVLIFLGLGVFYFANMRRFYEQDIGRSFKNGISLLTLLATAFLTCAYTGRFIFPMLSLEGRKFWILGLLPLNRDRLLWGKFAFSALGCLVGTEFIVAFSNLMLGMPWEIVVVHALAIAVVALGLSGLSVGLGALMPNFRETDPSKIAVGFGGTLNLVASLLFLLVVIAAMALPMHLWLGITQATGSERAVPGWMWGLAALGAVVGLAATVAPLRAGARQLRTMEF
jgi:ABC-2 type transport system permease protein